MNFDVINIGIYLLKAKLPGMNFIKIVLVFYRLLIWRYNDLIGSLQLIKWPK